MSNEAVKPAKRDSWIPDLMLIVQFTVAGGAFTFLGLALDVNSDFFRGFFTGFGPTAGIVITFILIFHLVKGRSIVRYKRNDERIKQLAIQAAAISFWVMLMVLAVLSFVVFSEISIAPRTLVPALMGGLALFDLAVFMILLKRY